MQGRSVKLSKDDFARRWHLLSDSAAFEMSQALAGRALPYDFHADTDRAASTQTFAEREQMMLNEARAAIKLCAASPELTIAFRAAVKRIYDQAAGASTAGAGTDHMTLNPAKGAGKRKAAAQPDPDEPTHVPAPPRSSKSGPKQQRRYESAGAAPKRGKNKSKKSTRAH